MSVVGITMDDAMARPAVPGGLAARARDVIHPSGIPVGAAACVVPPAAATAYAFARKIHLI